MINIRSKKIIGQQIFEGLGISALEMFLTPWLLFLPQHLTKLLSDDFIVFAQVGLNLD